MKLQVPAILQAKGLIEFRAQRNALASPALRVTTVWESMGDWMRFTESKRGQAIQRKLRGLAVNSRAEIWVPSPYLPEPVKAIKR